MQRLPRPSRPPRPPDVTTARQRGLAPALSALALLSLLGCASRSVEIAPLPANPAQFLGWSCERIDEEAELTLRRAADVAWAVDERAGNNIVALGIGVTVFWPALLALRPQGPEAEELARFKGRYEALREAAARRSCAAPGAEMPAARAAALAVAAGERLVYELRTDTRRAAIEQVWVLAALRRDELEYAVPRGAPPGPALRHDHAGNVNEAQAGMLMWPNLLRSELVLGQVMAGEIQLVGDPLARARVRAQVVALGPQEVGGRRFDAAVMELFGDVLQGEGSGAGSTRLDGVLVIDRASGVLLRLDLRSAQPPFRGTRRLVRVEAAGAP